MSERSSVANVEPPTQEYVLRVMASNYTPGCLWDHLDLETCNKAADEIERLRAGDSYRAAWLEMVDRCNVLKDENYQLRHPAQQMPDRAALARALFARRWPYRTDIDNVISNYVNSRPLPGVFLKDVEGAFADADIALSALASPEGE